MVGNAQYQKDDPNCPAHTGHDPERDNYYPGITDSVYVIFNADPQVSALQTAADLENGPGPGENHAAERSASDVVTSNLPDLEQGSIRKRRTRYGQTAGRHPHHIRHTGKGR